MGRRVAAGGQPEPRAAGAGSLFKGPSCWLLAAVWLLLRDRHKWVMGFMHVRGWLPPLSLPLGSLGDDGLGVFIWFQCWMRLLFWAFFVVVVCFSRSAG